MVVALISTMPVALGVKGNTRVDFDPWVSSALKSEPQQNLRSAGDCVSVLPALRLANWPDVQRAHSKDGFGP